MRLTSFALLTTLGIAPALPAQEAAKPVSVIEIGPYALGPDFSAHLTHEGRILFHEGGREPEAPPRQAIWEGRSGMLVRHNLLPFKAEPASAFNGCGGIDIGPSTMIWSNQLDLDWNPVTRRFRLVSYYSSSPRELDEDGGQHDGPSSHSDSTAKITVIDPNCLQVEDPQGFRWEVSMPWLIPPDFPFTPLQRAVSRGLGFCNALADRKGAWLLTEWQGAVANAPGRLLPFVPDQNPRWQLWKQGDPKPVMDVPLGSILGQESRLISMGLNATGDRIVVTTDRQVILFDPTTQTVLLFRPGRLEAQLPECNRLILSQAIEGGTRMLSIDLATGQKVAEFVIPESLDQEKSAPTIDADVDTEETSSQSSFNAQPLRRVLSDPVAFSPDGRYVLVPRVNTRGWHWDGLVLWEFPQP